MTEGYYAVEFLKTDHQRLRNTLVGCKGEMDGQLQRL